MGVSQELIKGTVVPVVLALLKDRPRYGYEMVQLVNARTNGALDWSEGTLYPVLHKLEADGLVSAEWRTAARRRGGASPAVLRALARGPARAGTPRGRVEGVHRGGGGVPRGAARSGRFARRRV